MTKFDESDLAVPPGFANRCSGYGRVSHIDDRVGSIHMSYGTSVLAPEGIVNPRVQSYEESFYIISGRPVLELDGLAYQLCADDCGLIPVGATHAWRNPGSEPARWIDMKAPQPRHSDMTPDTFFVPSDELQSVTSGSLRPANVRDPRNRHLFHLDQWLMDVDALKVGADVESSTVSASMATALLAYSGIAVKMLVDERLGAALQCMFMVEYQPGGDLLAHDHPFEEAHYFLEGAVEMEADGRSYDLAAGDVVWTGVGCVHKFYNRGPNKVRWLETRAPLPPLRHAYRFDRDWEHMRTIGT